MTTPATVLVPLSNERLANLTPEQERELFVSKGFTPQPEITFAYIAKAIRRLGMAETQFGREAVGDPQLVRDMRNGRQLGYRVQNLVRAYIERLDAKAVQS